MKRGNFALFHYDPIGNPAGDVYLHRWRLLQTPWFAIYLHKIVRSDDDRDLHDHPWPFVSIILRGGYWEQTPVPGHSYDAQIAVFNWRGPGAINVHRASDLHRVELQDNRPCWTLVFCGPRGREWGFQTPNGWVPWRQYLKEKEAAQ